jgi:phosphoenolpyruvate-protein kinase (PTS system EI component)
MVGLCGEMAGDLEAVPILVGLGLDEFSVSPIRIPAVKKLIQQLDRAEMTALAERAVHATTPEEVRAIVRAELRESNAGGG